jgi:CPA2 family monovalent cation:H+ antiporter-2
VGVDPSQLLLNLVVALLAALAGAVGAIRLRQSPILGFIVAGIAIGPHTPGFVGDPDAVGVLADIGIILLMFSIGVQFSFRDLLRVGKLATVGSTTQVLLTVMVGFLIGVALGWRPIEALFFGAVISNSSSTVLGKVLGDRAEMGTRQGQIALAWSAVQDLGTVVMIVILSALATGGDDVFGSLIWDTGKAAIYLIVVVPIGWFVLPWMFGQVAALRSREVFILAVGVVALGTAYAASFFGLSLALGAFLAGIVVGESDLSHQILGDVLPLRDIFAGLFFVSVGMLVDPRFVLENIPLVGLTLGLIVLFKGTLVAVLAILLGVPIRTAVLTGAALAQSAEFSFLLARLGADLEAVSATVFSLMLAGAATSILLHPTVYRLAVPLATSVAHRFPARGSMPATEPGEPADPGPRGHAVICGYGRVGRVIGSALRRRGFRYVVIEEDPRIVRRLRERGVTAIQGNAANPLTLAQAKLSQARVLVIAIADPLPVRQIVDHVRREHPRLDIIVRVQTEAEGAFLFRRGVGEAVFGELETALEMTRRTLHRFGLSAPETQAIVQSLRSRALQDTPRDAREPGA